MCGGATENCIAVLPIVAWRGVEATFDGLSTAACDCGWCSIAVFRHALRIPQSFEADSTWPELVLAHHVMA